MDSVKNSLASDQCVSKKEVAPATSHILDAIKMIVNSSKNEDFRRRCFAYFEVQDRSDFTQALSNQLTSIARRRFGHLSDPAREIKETSANGTMEKENCSPQNPVLQKGDELFSSVTTLHPKSSCIDSPSTPTLEHGTGGKATGNQHFGFTCSSDISWDTTACNPASEKNETKKLEVENAITLHYPDKGIQNHAKPIIYAGMRTTRLEILKDPLVTLKQNSLEKEGHGEKFTQHCRTQSCQYNNPKHFSEQDDWPSDFSWVDTEDDNSPPTQHLPSINCCHPDKVQPSDMPHNFQRSGCPATDHGYPSMSFESLADMNGTIKQNEVDQCVPIAGNDTPPVDEALDDFESLAKLL